tara:strand:+ start:887 stop:1006 length:120 start_codon:yes stop_codon:yes gene_type:complete
VGFSGFFVNPQDIEWTNVNAGAAAFFCYTFVVINNDWNH